jgi:RNA polymerase sigma factor (sigma-70 family)
MESQRGQLLSGIKRLVRDNAEAEDVLQDVFAEFVETYDLGLAFETVGGWLARVARNKVLDRFRRKKTQDEYRLLIQSAADQKLASDPEEERTREFLRTQITAALETLPPEQREVFVQHELEGKSFEEISAITGISVNTLLSRKRYAVLALRNYLKEVYDEL